MRDLSIIFKALSDETRLSILSLLLSHGELCVCDVEHVLDITQSKSSRHLRYLSNAGLVRDRRDGIWVHYRIPEDLDDERRRILEALAPLLTGGKAKELDRRLGTWLSEKDRDRTGCSNT